MSVQIASGLSKKYLKLTESTRKGIITLIILLYCITNLQKYQEGYILVRRVTK